MASTTSKPETEVWAFKGSGKMLESGVGFGEDKGQSRLMAGEHYGSIAS
jgi:hypothetical protein